MNTPNDQSQNLQQPQVLVEATSSLRGCAGQQSSGVATDDLGESNLSLGKYLHAFRKRWLLALLIGMPIAALAAGGVWRFSPKTYTTTALLRVAPAEKNLIFETAGANPSNSSTYDLYKRTQRQLIRSRFIIEPALRDEKLANLPILQKEIDPVAWLESRLNIAFLDDSEMMAVSLSGPMSEGLDTLVNSVLRVYFEKVVDVERTQRVKRLDDLVNAHTKFEDDLRSKRIKLKQFSELVGPGGASALTQEQQDGLQKYTAYRQQLQTVQFELMEFELELDNSSDIAEQSPELFAQALNQALLADAEYQKLVFERSRILKQIESHKKLLKPDVAAKKLDEFDLRLKKIDLQAEARKKALRTELADQRTRSVLAWNESNARQLKLLKAREQRLQQEIDKINTDIRVPRTSIDAEMLQIDINNLQDIVTRLASEIQRSNVEMKPDGDSETGSYASRVTSLSAAAPAVCLDSKSRMTKSLGAGGASLIGIILLFVWLEARKDHVHSGAEAGQNLGIPVIGNVPMIPRRVMQRLGDNTPRSRHWRTLLSESVDSIAALLLQKADHAGVKVIMVTSATAGEGKTTLAANLATSLAGAGRRTVLVDFDLRRPTLHRVFDLSLRPGVCDVLENPDELFHAVQGTGTPNLMMLPSGWKGKTGLTGLFSRSIRLLFDGLRENFDVVVVDASPILPVVDTRLIAQHVDCVALSALRDVSRTQQMQKACDILATFQVPILGLVVTGSHSEAYPASYYQQSSLADAT